MRAEFFVLVFCHHVSSATSLLQEGSCDVEVLKSGKLVLVHRRQHVVFTAVVGPEQCVIRPDHLQGFALEVPCDAFAEDQEIMIRVS